MWWREFSLFPKQLSISFTFGIFGSASRNGQLQLQASPRHGHGCCLYKNDENQTKSSQFRAIPAFSCCLRRWRKGKLLFFGCKAGTIDSTRSDLIRIAFRETRKNPKQRISRSVRLGSGCHQTKTGQSHGGAPEGGSIGFQIESIRVHSVPSTKGQIGPVPWLTSFGFPQERAGIFRMEDRLQRLAIR